MLYKFALLAWNVHNRLLGSVEEFWRREGCSDKFLIDGWIYLDRPTYPFAMSHLMLMGSGWMLDAGCRCSVITDNQILMRGNGSLKSLNLAMDRSGIGLLW